MRCHPFVRFAVLGLSLLVSASVHAAEVGVDPAAAKNVEAGPGPLDPNAVPQLLKNLEAGDVKIAAAAARSLGVIFAPGGKGEPADQPEVIAALTAKLPSQRGGALRREAATALGLIEAKPAVEPLTEAMADSDITVAIAAGEALARILPADEARALFAKRVAEESESIKAASYAGLAPIAKAEDAKLLADGLEIKNWRLQMHAVRGLEKAVRSGARIDPAVYDGVAGVLGAETIEAAETAMHFLLHIRDSECLRAAIAAGDVRGDGGKEDVTWRTRGYAIRTIRHLDWPATRAALPVVVRNLGDSTTNVSNEAHNFLNWLRNEHLLSHESLFPVLAAELEGAESLATRAAIMKEMGDQIPRDYASGVAKSAEQTLADARKDPEAWPARAAAVKVLGLCQYTGAIEDVAATVDDDVANARVAAGNALAQLAPLATPEQRKAVAEILLPLLQKSNDWHKTAVAAQAAGDYAQPEMIVPLAALLSHSVINVKEGASHSLVEIAHGQDDKLREQVDVELQSAFAAGDGSWEYGAKVIGAVRNPKGLALLVPVLRSKNWRAQANAAGAVAEIAVNTQTKIEDPALTEALINASQSTVLQVQSEADKALRAVTRGE